MFLYSFFGLEVLEVTGLAKCCWLLLEAFDFKNT